METSSTSQLINYAETVREVNDVLQGRSDASIDMLLSTLRGIEKKNPYYASAVSDIQEKIEAFQFQKMLRSKPYTRTGSQAYQYKLWEYDPAHPLKMIARILKERKINTPRTTEFLRTGRTDHYDPDDPCGWNSPAVAKILEQKEYLGHTVNFKTTRKSFKNKKVIIVPTLTSRESLTG